MKYCQECNLDFPGSYRFCGSCGGALSDSLRCQGCGELAESRWTFCTNCGRQLLSESAGGQAVPPGPPEPADIPSAPPRSSATLGNSASHEMIMAVSEQQSSKVTPQEWYAAPDLFEETSETTVTPSPRQRLVPTPPIAVPLLTARSQGGNGKTAPTLTMLAAYGESETGAPPEWQGQYKLLLGLLLLILFGLLGTVGWYWWTHGASVAQSTVQADSSTAPPAADSSSSLSSTSSATTTSGRTTTSNTADEELKRLRERRTSAKPSENSEIITALEAAERKYPRDYRFPYERAKLSIKGITSHHEAFGALALAANKAVDNGKAQEMLDSLMADQDGDFYKLSRGHREWRMLAQALGNRDKKTLSELHH